MKITLKSGLLLLTGVLVASALGCLLALQLRPQPTATHLHAHGHEVLQRELGLNAEQTSRLEALEEPFLRREAELKAAHAAAIGKLADALAEDQSFSPRVEAAIAEIHQTQAELQKATIEHLLDMKPALTSEQYQQLLHRVSEALRRHSTTAQPES